jgi:hypothetical protein
MNLISIVIGLVALCLALVGFTPLLGWLNWLVIPLAVVGTAFGILARGTSGRNLNILRNCELAPASASRAFSVQGVGATLAAANLCQPALAQIDAAQGKS